MVGWLDNQVALITGAGSGIGRAVARRFVSEGARIIGLERCEDRAGELERELGRSAAVVVGDASTAAANADAVALAVASYGRLDTLVCNVGVFDWHKRLDRMSADECAAAYEEIFAINVRSFLFAAREAHPHLRRARGSAILTCSVASFRAGGGGTLYTASKFAVRGLVHQLAHEWAPDVRVNGVAPGGTTTALAGAEALGHSSRVLDEDAGAISAIAEAAPLGFAAAPEDHAGLYVMLASSREARAVTGTIVVSDGGLLSRI